MLSMSSAQRLDAVCLRVASRPGLALQVSAIVLATALSCVTQPAPPINEQLMLVALAILAVIAGCYGTLSMSVPIGGGYHGPYGSVGIPAAPSFSDRL